MNWPVIKTWEAGFAGLRMLGEAQGVIFFRMLGMAGLWGVAASENERMIAEKAPAFAAAQIAATQAMMRGASPDEVFTAWLNPIGRRTRANHRRLSRLGPRIR